jgi:hypothetical protein
MVANRELIEELLAANIMAAPKGAWRDASGGSARCIVLFTTNYLISPPLSVKLLMESKRRRMTFGASIESGTKGGKLGSLLSRASHG